MDAERKKWNREYEEKGIPSSFRETPSSALRWALGALDYDPAGKSVLDIGCGAGRNSLYMAKAGAHVTGFDLSDIAIAQATRNLQEKAPGANAVFRTGSLTDALPVAPQSQDMILDLYVGFHISNKEHRLKMHRDAAQALKPDGVFVRAVCAYDDGYYGNLEVLERPNDKAKIVNDGITGVAVVLYDLDMFLEEAAADFELAAFYHERQPSLMYGKTYPRSNYVAAFRKKGAWSDGIS